MKAAGRHVVCAVQNGLGDVIMALPALIELDRGLERDARLTLLVLGEWIAGLLRLHPWEREIEIISFDYSRRWDYLSLLRIALRLRAMRPDAFLAMHSTERLLPSLFARLVGAPLSVGPQSRWWWIGFNRTVPPARDLHKVYHYERFLRTVVPGATMSTNLDMPLSAPVLAQARNMTAAYGEAEQWIFLAPGSGPVEQHKRWPEEYYRQLAIRILTEWPQYGVGLFGGAGDRPTLRNLAAALAQYSGRCGVFAQEDVGVSLALLRQARCVVSGCTGPIHLAALAGVPIVGIYGPTNYSSTGPFSPSARIVRKGLTCSPCYRVGFREGCGTPRCMTTIDVDKVFAAVKKILAGENYPPLPPLVTTNATKCALVG